MIVLDFWHPSSITRVHDKSEKAVCLPVFLQLKLPVTPSGVEQRGVSIQHKKRDVTGQPVITGIYFGMHPVYRFPSV